LPGGGGKSASQIKEGEKIIEDKKFYQDFFKEIEREVSIVSAIAEKEKSLKTAQLVEKPQVVSASKVQETVTQEVNVASQNASNQGKEEVVSSESKAK
jgi:hypothetical protein